MDVTRRRRRLADLGATAVVGACVTLALLFGGTSLPRAEAAMPDVAATPAVDDLLAAPGDHATPVARGSIIDGRAINADISLSTDPVDVLADRYRDRLERRGVHVTERRLGVQRYVGGLAADGHQVGVLLRPVKQPDGTVDTVIIPVSARGTYQPGAEATSLDLPLPPDHVMISSGRSQTGRMGATTAELICPQAPKDVARFYRKALARRGFGEATRGARIKGKDGALLLRFRGPDGDLATVGIHRVDSGHSAVFLLHEDHPDANQPQGGPSR